MSYVSRSSRLQSTASGASITFSAPGADKYNLLTSLVVESDAAATVTIQSPSGTTIWQTKIPAGGGFSEVWPFPTGPKGANNGAMVIACSAGTYTMSAGGYVTP